MELARQEIVRILSAAGHDPSSIDWENTYYDLREIYLNSAEEEYNKWDRKKRRGEIQLKYLEQMFGFSSPEAENLQLFLQAGPEEQVREYLSSPEAKKEEEKVEELKSLASRRTPQLFSLTFSSSFLTSASLLQILCILSKSGHAQAVLEIYHRVFLSSSVAHEEEEQTENLRERYIEWILNHPIETGYLQRVYDILVRQSKTITSLEFFELILFKRSMKFPSLLLELATLAMDIQDQRTSVCKFRHVHEFSEDWKDCFSRAFPPASEMLPRFYLECAGYHTNCRLHLPLLISFGIPIYTCLARKQAGKSLPKKITEALLFEGETVVFQ